MDYRCVNLLDGRPPSQLSELAYARFCRRFEAETTSRIAALRPDAVITHDISEGPDFAHLERLGIPCVPVFHVDVVDFFNRIYLGGWLSPGRAAGVFRRLRRLPIPDVLRLVFDKQEDAVSHCPRLVVPSAAMGPVLQSCYPDMDSDKLETVPWGAPDTPPEAPPGDEEELRRAWGLRGGPVLLTLSRISPEKGQDRLLEALAVGEQRGEMPANLDLVLCGEAAYMKGRRFLRHLGRLAERLGQARVVFAGHVGGPPKRATYRLADLFVSPSRHESYGLTTMEALSEGTPVLAVRTYGAEATVDSRWGRLVEPGPGLPLRLWLAIRDLLRRPADLRRMGEAGREAARQQTFGQAAARLLEISRSAARKE